MKSTEKLEKRLLDFLAAGRPPLRQHELAAALGLKAAERAPMRHLLRELERKGRVALVRKNRWTLPSAARQRLARLRGLPSGGGVATAEEAPPAEWFVPRDGLAGAIDGDRVVLDLAGGGRRGSRDDRPRASVQRVVDREGRKLAGLLLQGHGYWYVVPHQPRIAQNIHLTGFAGDFGTPQPNREVLVRLHEWAGPVAPLAGEAVEDLGAANDKGIALRSMLRERGLDPLFESSVLHEAEQRQPALTAQDLAGREDFRNQLAMTIDPVDARDFDDAVTIQMRPDGGWDLGVHIADVAHFVAKGSEIDREAMRRGNSVYLTGSFIPMLPHHLTSVVCSLRPGEDRLTHSVLLQLDAAGTVVSSRTCRSVIHSRARLTYDEVQRVLEDGLSSSLDPAVLDTLRVLHTMSRVVRTRRMRAGSLDLAMPEVDCELDADGQAVAFHRRAAPEAYQLIEECMLLANVAVARAMASQRVPALYRIHEEPEEEQYEAMGEQLAILGVTRQPSTPADINTVCRSVAGTPRAYPVNLAILRNLKRATYSAARVPHFGLAFTHYTHFTSPIRRYPDLVVHRILNALEGQTRPPYGHDEIQRIAQHASLTERAADEAEQESLDLVRIAFYRKRLEAGETGPYRVLITGIANRGLLVEVEDSLQRGLVPLGALPHDHYQVEPSHGYIRSLHNRKNCYRVGQLLDVELMRVDAFKRLVDFRPWGDGVPAMQEPAPPKRRKRQRIR